MQSHHTAKHSLSALLAIQIVPVPSTTLPMLFITRFEQLGRIEDLEDAISSYTVKHSLSVLLAIQIVPVPQQPCQCSSTRFLEQLGQVEDLEDAISSPP
jgi:hypothetical protein